MNILIFASYYYPHIGGYDKNVHELAKRLVVKGHRVHVLTCNTEKTTSIELVDGVLVFRMNCYHLLGKTYPVPIPFGKFFNELFILRQRHCDIVITQTRFFILSFLGLLFAKLNRIPLIHVERGTCHSIVSNKLISIIAQIIDHTMGFSIVKGANANVGVSNAACKFIEHLGGCDTMTIYNGIE